MADRGIAKFQIGKSGVTDGVIESLNLCFKTHKTVRISVLRNAVSTRSKIKQVAEEMADKLDGKFKFIIIGFTIVMRKSNEKSKK